MPTFESLTGPFLWTADSLAGQEQAMNLPVGGTIFFAEDLAGGLYVVRVGENAWMAIDQTNDDPVVDWDREQFRDFITQTMPWAMNQ